ncbi:MAG: histidine phosphatase family protein, partial [Ferruginibacter sp.]|nr:histidine phosphatase family protein [Ferruginibacter sp.]
PLDYTEDYRLAELNFGDWENKKWNEIDEEQMHIWMNDFVNISPPNGENYKNLHERTSNFIEALLETDYHKIAIITHAGNIRSFMSWALDLPLENSFRIELAYGAVVVLQINKNKNFNKLISIQ